MGFSERGGLPLPAETAAGLETGKMNRRVRTALWNTVLSRLFGQLSANSNGLIVQDYHVFIALWRQFFCLPMDEFPRLLSERRDTFRDFFEVAEWHRIYDFLEHAAGRMTAHDAAIWTREINAALEQEGAGYRMVGRCIVPLGHTMGSVLLDDAIDLFTTYEWESVHKALARACRMWSALKTNDQSPPPVAPSDPNKAAKTSTGGESAGTGKVGALETVSGAALEVFISAVQSATDLAAFFVSSASSQTGPASEGEQVPLPAADSSARNTHPAETQADPRGFTSAQHVMGRVEEMAKIQHLKWPEVLVKQLFCTAQTLLHAVGSENERADGSLRAPGCEAFLTHEVSLGFGTHSAVLILDQCVKTGLLKPRERLAHRATIQDPWGERRVGS